jgi:hypothetical protein
VPSKIAALYASGLSEQEIPIMKQPSGGEALAQTVEQALGSRLVEVRRSGPLILITSNTYVP